METVLAPQMMDSRFTAGPRQVLKPVAGFRSSIQSFGRSTVVLVGVVGEEGSEWPEQRSDPFPCKAFDKMSASASCRKKSNASTEYQRFYAKGFQPSTPLNVGK